MFSVCKRLELPGGLPGMGTCACLCRQLTAEQVTVQQAGSAARRLVGSRLQQARRALLTHGQTPRR